VFPIAIDRAPWPVPELDPSAIVVVFTVSAPLRIVLDAKVAVPPTLAAFVTTNELAVVVPEALAKVRAALPAAVPALL
jgi:riboflavin biosynthesis pyrimidine reductase